MSKYRKKPVVIEAVQFEGTREGQQQVEQFIGGVVGSTQVGDTLTLWIETLEGGHVASPCDWIIRGVKGEFYPCKPDIFASTYEAINEEAEAP